MSEQLPPAPGRAGLRADCARCAGLCCVVPAFSVSADFALDKRAGEPCPHLRTDHRCGIHAELRERGFPGCVAYDCFGAGQQVVQITFGGQDWRRTPEIAESVFTVFPVVRQLHELRWYLTEAVQRAAADPLGTALRRVLDETEQLSRGRPDQLAGLDVAAHRRVVGELLGRTSELVRARVPPPRADLRGADLIGRDLRGAGLRGAALTGAYLIGADLRDADLCSADLLGADLRGADLRGADLTGSIFLTPVQVGAANGDGATALPSALDRPGHWTG